MKIPGEWLHLVSRINQNRRNVYDFVDQQDAAFTICGETCKYDDHIKTSEVEDRTDVILKDFSLKCKLNEIFLLYTWATLCFISFLKI